MCVSYIQIYVSAWLVCTSICECMTGVHVCVNHMVLGGCCVCSWERWGWVVVCLQTEVFWKEWGWEIRGIGGCEGGSVWIGGNCG